MMKNHKLVEQLKNDPYLFSVLAAFIIGSAVLAGVVYAFPGGSAHLLRLLLLVPWLGYAALFSLSTYAALAAVSLAPSLLLLAIVCVTVGAWLPLGLEFVVHALLAGAGAGLAWYIETHFAPRTQALDLLEAFDKERKSMGEMFGRFVQISSAYEISKVLDGTVKVLAQSFDVQRAIIFTAEHDTRLLKPMRTVGYRLTSPDQLCIKVAEPFWMFPDFDPYNLNPAAKQRIADLQRVVSAVANDVVVFIPVISDGRMTGGLGIQKPATQEQLQSKLYLLYALGLMIGNGFSNSMNRGALVKKIDQAHQETAKIQQQQDTLKQAFSRYVSSSVVEEISRNAGMINVGGKRQVITILFADLRGFTALASKMPNEGLALLLNDWLERASQRLFQLDGTIDKFLGDGIMALFGAPLPQADHALRAAYTAFNLQETFEAYLSENRNTLEGNTVGLGIGIATGTVVVGNFGSRRRMEFTAVGDAVNLAARLEKVAEDGDIIVDKATLNLLQDRFAFATKSKVALKGKEPMDVYRLTGVKIPWGS